VDNCDKKKSELYFSFSVKKFLTKKQNERVPKQQIFLLRAIRDSSTTTGIFFAASD